MAPNYLALAVRYLARADRTAGQVERYVRQKGASRTEGHAIVRELERRGYLDDLAYATRWAEARLLRQPMGRERLKIELFTKGFEESVTERALRKAYQSTSEQELACQALEGRAGRTRPMQWVRFLRQRGFDEDTIQQVTQIDLETGLDEL
ncbi:MAG: putative Regulatory protein RecX [Nitrospira sp.]|jgi:regulatory protein|nr:putative Regulatory protein RecX [Nitrospira sp.]